MSFVSTGSAQTPRPELAPLNWMIGDWEGYEQGGDTALRIGLHARLAENGQAINFTVNFAQNGKVTPKYDGMYYWHPGERQIKLLQTSSEGNVSEGVYAQRDSLADQFVTVRSSNGSTFELKSHWQIAPTSFRFVGEFRPSGKDVWQPAVDAIYRRVTTTPH